MFNNVCTIFTHIISNIIYVIVHCVLLIFIMANTIVIGIKLPKTNLAFFLILLLLCLILAILGGILICYVQRKHISMQMKIKILTIVGLITTILFLVLTIVEEIILSVDYSKVKNKQCFTEKIDPYGIIFKKNNNIGINNNTNLERVLSDLDIDINIGDCINSYLFKTVKKYSYFTLTFMEIISIISIIYWIQNKKKHVDQPVQTQTITNNAQQVVVQPSAVVINPVSINGGYIVSPGQQYYPNYYPQQAIYTNNQMVYNNPIQGQQYVQGNYNQNVYNNNYPAPQPNQNNNNIVQNNINGNENNIQNHVLDENLNNVNSSERQVNNKP